MGKIRLIPKSADTAIVSVNKAFLVVIATAHEFTLVTHAAASKLRLSLLNMKPK